MALEIIYTLIELATNQVFGMLIGLIVLSAIFSYEGLFDKLRHFVLILVFTFGFFYNIFVFMFFDNFVNANIVLFIIAVLFSIFVWRIRIYVMSKSKKLADSIRENI